jgi:hypothetical protein
MTILLVWEKNMHPQRQEQRQNAGGLRCAQNDKQKGSDGQSGETKAIAREWLEGGTGREADFSASPLTVRL